MARSTRDKASSSVRSPSSGARSVKLAGKAEARVARREKARMREVVNMLESIRISKKGEGLDGYELEYGRGEEGKA